jgi:hypothetical protein
MAGSTMSSITVRQGYLDTMTTRSAVIVTIGIIAALMVSMAIAALFAGDITERQGAIVTSVLGSLATVLAGLLLFLRVETVNGKVDDAAVLAAVAAQNAAAADRKIAQVHHDVLNGPLRQNVRQAIEEAEADPAIIEQRIDNAAKGVSKDRHDKRQRETVEQGWEGLAQRGIQRPPRAEPDEQP